MLKAMQALGGFFITLQDEGYLYINSRQMERISFVDVLPHVFAQREDLASEVWRCKLDFVKGETCLVEAESGKGKSTFCSYVTGYRHDYEGTIMFDGDDIRRYAVKDWTNVRTRVVSHLFQELRLFPELTAYENVEIKNRLTGWKSRKDIMAWFERLGIADKTGVRIGMMSFGQQQRVAMMRALAQPFDFILLDEPISHLDDANSAIMGEILMEEAGAQGAGVIVTSIGKHMELEYSRVIRL